MARQLPEYQLALLNQAIEEYRANNRKEAWETDVSPDGSGWRNGSYQPLENNSADIGAWIDLLGLGKEIPMRPPIDAGIPFIPYEDTENYYQQKTANTPPVSGNSPIPPIKAIMESNIPEYTQTYSPPTPAGGGYGRYEGQRPWAGPESKTGNVWDVDQAPMQHIVSALKAAAATPNNANLNAAHEQIIYPAGNNLLGVGQRNTGISQIAGGSIAAQNPIEVLKAAKARLDALRAGNPATAESSFSPAADGAPYNNPSFMPEIYPEETVIAPLANLAQRPATGTDVDYGEPRDTRGPDNTDRSIDALLSILGLAGGGGLFRLLASGALKKGVAKVPQLLNRMNAGNKLDEGFALKQGMTNALAGRGYVRPTNIPRPPGWMREAGPYREPPQRRP